MENNKKDVLNNQTNNEEGKKKKKGIALWWKNLSRGTRTAIYISGGLVGVAGVTLGTVFGVKSCSNNAVQRKITVDSTEVQFSSSFESDGSLKANIKPSTGTKEIDKLEIKIGNYTLKDTEFIFNKESGELTISSDVIKAHDGNVVIKPTLKDIAPEKFTIHFDVNGGTGNIPDVEVEKGGTISAPTVEPDISGDNSFIGWYLSPDGNDKFDFNTPILNNLTLYAHYGIKEIVLSYDSQFNSYHAFTKFKLSKKYIVIAEVDSSHPKSKFIFYEGSKIMPSQIIDGAITAKHDGTQFTNLSPDTENTCTYFDNNQNSYSGKITLEFKTNTAVDVSYGYAIWIC